MNKIKVLFVCIHNSARSQMAEAYLKKIGGDLFHAESAGLEPGQLNPFVVQVMKEDGIDLSQNKTKSVFDIQEAGEAFDFVITVCDQASAERCPVFPGVSRKIHWSFQDPSSFTGNYETKLEKTRIVRDEIKRKITAWVKEITAKESKIR